MLVKIICKTLLYFVMNVVDNILLSDSLQSQLKVKWLLTQGVINHVKTVINGLTLLRRSHTTAARQGGFIVPYVWEIVVRKHVTNFEGCHFARFYILIWWSFPKIETKSFNSGPCFFKLVKLGTISPAAHFLNWVHIGRNQTIAAIICGLSFGKRFVKLREVF